MTAEQQEEFYAGFVPPAPPDPEELERQRMARMEAIEAAGGEVAG